MEKGKNRLFSLTSYFSQTSPLTVDDCAKRLTQFAVIYAYRPSSSDQYNIDLALTEIDEGENYDFELFERWGSEGVFGFFYPMTMTVGHIAVTPNTGKTVIRGKSTTTHYYFLLNFLLLLAFSLVPLILLQPKPITSVAIIVIILPAIALVRCLWGRLRLIKLIVENIA